MTKEQKDKILSIMGQERNDYVIECQRRATEEHGKVEGADYMLQRLFDFLKEKDE